MAFLSKTRPPPRFGLVAVCISLGALFAFVSHAGPRGARPPPEKWENAPGGMSLSVGFPAWAGCPRTPCSYSSMGDGPVNTSVPWNSQFGEDEWLYKHLFHGKSNGFYLEMGAMNGIDLSNTLFFERAAGWRGLLIEADPSEFIGVAPRCYRPRTPIHPHHPRSAASPRRAVRRTRQKSPRLYLRARRGLQPFPSRALP